MGATRTSTTSTNVETASGELEADGSSSSYSCDIATQLGDSCGTGDFGAAIGASATAYGTDTYSDLSIDAQVSASSLNVDVSATSTAQSDDPYAYAYSTAQIDIQGSAHAYVGIMRQSTSTDVGPEGSTVTSTYDAAVSAVNLGGGGAHSPAPETGTEPPPPLTPPGDLAGEPDPYVPGDDISFDPCGCGGWDPVYDIEGNLAVFDIHAVAYGTDTFAEVMMDAIAVEGAFSDVTALVIVSI